MAAGGNGSEPQRCVAHGLAAGPDGLCVLCRREQQAVSSSEPRFGSSLSGWLVLGTVIMLLAAVGILGLGLMRSSDDEAQEGLAQSPGEPPAETPVAVEEATSGEEQPPRPGISDVERRRRALKRAKRRVRIKMYMTDW